MKLLDSSHDHAVLLAETVPQASLRPVQRRVARGVPLDEAAVSAAPEAMARWSFADAVNAGIHPVQCATAEHATPGMRPDEVAAIAARGVSAASSALPFGDQIARAFGRHDTSAIRCSVGGTAGEAAGALGAHAYATGDAIAFARAPDLHLAAHEAAHVIQQRAGVQLSDGIGRAGDDYERHADAVADAVVRGDSAEALLDAHPGGGSSGGGVQRAVQLRIEGRIGGFVFEDGSWRREDGGAMTAADRSRLRTAMVARARGASWLPASVRRAYVLHLEHGGDEPLPEEPWFRTTGHGLVRTEEDYARVMRAIERHGADDHAISDPAPGEPIRTRRPVGDDTSLVARSLDGTPSESTLLPLGGDSIAGNVRMDGAVRTGGDHVLHSGGFDACTGFSTVATGPDGTSRELGHVAASDRTGAYAQLIESIASGLPRGGGTIDAYVNTHPETRTAPAEGAAPIPVDHTDLVRALRRDLEARLGAGYRVRPHGNGLAVTDPAGHATVIHVGVDERPVDAGPTRITSGPEGLRVQTGDAPPELLDHSAAARIGHEGPARRAEAIRRILEARIAADPGSSSAALARLALADLDSEPPTVAHIDAVADTAGISDADIAAASEPPRGTHGPDGADPRTGPTGDPAAEEESTARPRTAGPDSAEPSTESTARTRTAGPDSAEPSTESTARPRTAGADSAESSTDSTARPRTAGPDSAEPSTESTARPRTAGPDSAESSTESTAHTRTAGPDSAEPSTDSTARPRTGAGTVEPSEPVGAARTAPVGEPVSGDVERRPRVEILREELGVRAESPDAETATRARRALEMLDEAGEDPSHAELEAAARHARVDLYRLSPRASSTDIDVSGSGVGVTHTGEEGGTTGARVSANAHGGGVEVTHTGGDGHESSVGVTYSETRDGEGEVVGRDVGLSTGRGPISGELSGGYTFRVEPAAEQAGGSYIVRWTVAFRGGVGATGTGTRGGGGGGLRGSATRSGSQVFGDGDREHNLAAAEAYRADFRSHMMREFERAAAGELGTVAWWESQPAGTSRRVAVGGSLTAEGSLSVMRTLRLGGSADISPSGEAEVTRGEGNLVTVMQAWEIAGGLSLSGGNIVSASYGGEIRHRVSETFAVDLDAAEEMFAGFLRHEHPIEAGAGVTLRSRREEDSAGDRMGVGVVLLGEVHGGTSTGETVDTTFDADGTAHETHTATGRDHMEGTAVDGTYVRSRYEISAPETDEDYAITHDVHGTEGESSAALLGDEMHEGRAGSRAESSGNWQITEGLTQDDALRFHRRLLAEFPRGGDPPPLGSPLLGVWLDLRDLPTDDDRLAGPAHETALRERRRRRAAAMTEFLADHHRDALSIVRHMAGGTDDSMYLRLFHGGAEDLTAVGEVEPGEDVRRRIPTFMGRERCRALEQWLAAHAERVTPEDATDARTRIADMDARIAQIANVDNYTDLPPDARAATLTRYRRYRDQLASIISRGGDEVAAAMSDDGRAHHDELRALQDRVTAMHDAASAPRDRVIDQRRRWGQMPGETIATGHLPARLEGRTGRMWSVAELAFTGGEDARAAADERLATSLGADTRGELDQLTAYRSATGDLERALASYETARDEMARLLELYDRIDLAERGELDAPAHPPAHRPESTDAPLRIDAPETETTTDASAPEAALDEHPARRERHGRRHARSGHATDEGAHGTRDGVIDNATLVSHMPTTLGGAATTGRIEFPSGLVVNLTRLIPVPGAVSDDGVMWVATMTIITPVPDADAFTVPYARAEGGGLLYTRYTDTVPNHAGQEFRSIANR